MSHSRTKAILAIADHLNAYRENALIQAQNDYITHHGQWNPEQEVEGVFYPPNGPTIPEALIEDPSDIRFIEGRIYRRLSLFADSSRPLNYVGGNSGGEPEHLVQLEWTVLSAASEAGNRQVVFNAGLNDVSHALQPLQSFGLTDPATGDHLAISFEVTGVDYQTHDFGDHVAQAAFITLSFTLLAASILA